MVAHSFRKSALYGIMSTPSAKKKKRSQKQSETKSKLDRRLVRRKRGFGDLVRHFQFFTSLLLSKLSLKSPPVTCMLPQLPQLLQPNMKIKQPSSEYRKPSYPDHKPHPNHIILYKFLNITLQVKPHYLSFIHSESHPAIPDRAQPDTSPNLKNSTEAPSSHTKALADPENRGIRIHMDSGCKLPPYPYTIPFS
ncbi:hypothetical protein L873DRAFT_1849310 [Choiromyces venosus 120613-1]|uniref:Uncharacterized protein n=1 Tax=Choiromyces venosus 120613-1 TaxID=1336337 RepID=A0A3N4IYN2_9PEZI|nr:hypothetical protein L873DRAFT_1849310 [Choiromyces venosus 120613-1]